VLMPMTNRHKVCIEAIISCCIQSYHDSIRIFSMLKLPAIFSNIALRPLHHCCGEYLVASRMLAIVTLICRTSGWMFLPYNAQNVSWRARMMCLPELFPIHACKWLMSAAEWERLLVASWVPLRVSGYMASEADESLILVQFALF